MVYVLVAESGIKGILKKTNRTDNGIANTTTTSVSNERPSITSKERPTTPEYSPTSPGPAEDNVVAAPR